jgi:hypothetical protein
MEPGQSEAVEENLWGVLRTLEERTSLLQELAARAREQNQPGEGAKEEAWIGCLEEDIVPVRTVRTSRLPAEPMRKTAA